MAAWRAMVTGPEQLQSVEVGTYTSTCIEIRCCVPTFVPLFITHYFYTYYTAPGVPNNPDFQLDDAVCGKVTISWDEPLEDEQIGQ